MPTVDDQIGFWDKKYDWLGAGEEWSSSWGNSELQWHMTVLPRIARFLPAGTILELAPGFGRWTHYIKDHCRELIVVDLAARCIEACRQRFASASHITYHVNDGKSLDMVPDRSIDFAFSFDSLVHVEVDIIGAYLNQLARKLKPDGVGFIHHSNIGSYRRELDLSRRLPTQMSNFLINRGILIRNFHSRAETMTAESFLGLCDRHGLRCMSQEIISWGEGHTHLIDCLSMFTPKASTYSTPTRRIVNRKFMQEASRAKKLCELYWQPAGREQQNNVRNS
jgi:SAM-dependent methyltransferase